MGDGRESLDYRVLLECMEGEKEMGKKARIKKAALEEEPTLL